MNSELTSEEKLNYSSYSTADQLSRYNKNNLKSVEKKIIEDWFPKNKIRILDVGCGAGRTTINIHKLGHDVIGVDLVPSMIELAKKNFPEINFKVMNACELDFPDNYFDLVFFSYNGIDCIYPIEKRWMAIKEIFRVLKPGGLYIMSSHNSIVWPTNKYHIFWWVINIFSGRIFTPYRLEFKQLRSGIKFIYFARIPKRQIADHEKRGFSFLDIYANPNKKFFKKLFSKTKNLFLISVFENWPHYVFRKKS